MKIITFENEFGVVDQNDLPIANFSSKQEALDYIIDNSNLALENIEEQPFYEVDEHGQPIID